MQKRIPFIDNAKYILTVFIVMYHISCYEPDKGYEISIFIKNFGECTVPAFAIISGFLFWRNVRKFSDLKNKMLSRLYTLLLPYLLWNFINTIINNIVDNGLSNINVSIFDLNVWTDIILWNQSPHFWYIFMLMFWTVTSPVLLLLYKKKWGIAVLLIAEIAYIIAKGDNILHSRFIYIPYTWAGLLGYYKSDLLQKISENKTVLKAVVLTTIYLVIRIVIHVLDLEICVRVWLYAIEAMSLLWLLFMLPSLRIIDKTKKYTFWIFSVHFGLDRYVGGYIHQYISGIPYQFITFFAVMIVAVLSGFLVNKYVPYMYDILTGNRAKNL